MGEYFITTTLLVEHVEKVLLESFLHFIKNELRCAPRLSCTKNLHTIYD